MDTPVRDTTDSFLKDIDGLLREGSSFDAKLALDRIFPPEQSEWDEVLEHWFEHGGYLEDPHKFWHDADYSYVHCGCTPREGKLDVFKCLMYDSPANLDALRYSVEFQGREHILVKTGFDRPETVDQVERYFGCTL